MCKLRTFKPEEAFKLLNSHNHELKVDHLVEIQKQTVPEEIQGRKPEPKEKPMTVSKFSKGLSMIEIGIKVLEDEWNKQ
jgi:hypothetical protein